jgi:alkylmercury lyase
MTDPTGCAPASGLERAVAAFQRQAFAALLGGSEPPLISDIAETATREAIGVAEAIAWLEAHGRLERDGDLLIGAHGLTRRRTAHTLTIGEKTLHTWCAYDAVAIPVALAATARATTTCPTCHRTLQVDIDDGLFPETDTPVLWIPTGPCEHVMNDFCTQANLFCTADHLHTWREAAGDPAGRVVSFVDVPALARCAWADISDRP